ncbi:MAG TPA: hypothetical protein VG870_03645 [Chitinophagaceae bacterium]|nr:hypothetical protein [Chitinophagaceae bacterium]
MKSRFWKYSLAISIVSISYLLSPANFVDKGPNQSCPIKFVHITKYAGFPMTCDAFELVGGSIKPSYLFSKNYHRQSRPLYILSGSLFGYSIYFLSYPVHDLIREKAAPQFRNLVIPQRVPLYVSHFAGLVLINFIILLISLWLFESIIEKYSGTRKNGKILQFFLLVSLLANNVTKQFFWVPHFQMFNTLMPLLAIWFFTINSDGLQSKKRIFLQGCTTGILQLFYGSFILLLPVLVLSLYKYQLKREFIKRIVVILTGFAIPIALWFFIIGINHILPYSDEMERFREFIWIEDVLMDTNNSFLKELFENLRTYAGTSATFIFPLAFFTITYWIARTRRSPTQNTPIFSKEMKFIFGSTFVLTVLFFGLMGYYADRLTYSSTVILLCCAGIFANKVKLSNGWTTVLSAFIICWHLFLIFFEMPHFSDRFYR